MPVEASRPTVAVAIVTYLNRARLLSEVLEAVLAQTETERIRCVVVCDNGAGQETKQLLANVGRQEAKLQVVTLPENTGSAGGFSRAIRVASVSGCEYIWCLDDDNKPELDALEQLLWAVQAVEAGAALLSFRRDWPLYVRRARGASIEDAFGRRYNFLGLSLIDLPKFIVRRLSSPKAESNAGAYLDRPVLIPYAAFGGFFFQVRQLQEVGFPDEALYTGADDFEFTARFAAKGYPIYLVPKSHIKDLEDTWDNRTGMKRLLSHRMLFDSESDKINRAYYQVRNGVFFRSYRLGWGRHPAYIMNGLVYVFGMFAQALVLRLCGQRIAWRSFLTVLRGVKDGLQGRVGNN